MFRYQSFQAKLVSKAAGDVPPYPLTLADNGNLLIDFKTFTLYFFLSFFLGIASFWYHYVSECDSFFPQRILKLFCLSLRNIDNAFVCVLSSVIFVSFCVFVFLTDFVAAQVWLWWAPASEWGDLHIWGLPPSSVCRNSYFRQQPEKNEDKNSREILEKF